MARRGGRQLDGKGPDVGCGSRSRIFPSISALVDTCPALSAAQREVGLSLPVELVDHGGVPVASHHHLLFFELLGNLRKP